MMHTDGYVREARLLRTSRTWSSCPKRRVPLPSQTNAIEQNLKQNYRGRATSQEMWMFGLADSSRTPALGYMELVPTCRAATLLAIIQAHVAPGTIIYSDEWSAYHRVGGLPNVAAHETINHSIEFVNPTTGTRTQNIERYIDMYSSRDWILQQCDTKHNSTCVLCTSKQHLWEESTLNEIL